MATEFQITPGPWTVREDTCAQCQKEGKQEFTIDGPPGAYHGQFSNKADAHLIAAAPALLEALEEARIQIEQLHRMLGIKINGHGTLAVIDAAINTARGQP